MAIKKYLSLDKLNQYTSLVKETISNAVSVKADADHTHEIVVGNTKPTTACLWFKTGDSSAAEEEIIFAESTLQFEQNYQSLDGEITYFDQWYTDFANPVELIAGETYKVVWDGTEYTCVAEDALYQNNIPVVSIGNKSIGEMGEDTGEPFVIASNSGYSITMAQTFDQSATHTIEIRKIG